MDNLWRIYISGEVLKLEDRRLRYGQQSQLPRNSRILQRSYNM